MALPNISIGWPLNFDKALVAVGFMLVGYLLKPTVQAFGKYNCIIGMVCLGVSVFSFANIPDYGCVHMARGEYGNILYFAFFGLVGSFGIIMMALWVASKITKKHLISGVLTFIGNNTFTFLAVQLPVINVVSSLCKRVDVAGYIALSISFVLSTGICFVAVWGINKYAPYLGGKTAN